MILISLHHWDQGHDKNSVKHRHIHMPANLNYLCWFWIYLPLSKGPGHPWSVSAVHHSTGGPPPQRCPSSGLEGSGHTQWHWSHPDVGVGRSWMLLSVIRKQRQTIAYALLYSSPLLYHEKRLVSNHYFTLTTSLKATQIYTFPDFCYYYHKD